VVSVNSSHIMAIGGFSYNGKEAKALKEIRLLDITTDTWTLLPDLPLGVKHHACIMTEDGVIMTGGDESVSGFGWVGTDRTLIIDPHTGKIQKGSSMMTPRVQHQMVLVEDTVMAIAGRTTSAGNLLKSTEQYKKGSDWETAEFKGTWETAEFVLDSERAWFSTITISDTIEC